MTQATWSAQLKRRDELSAVELEEQSELGRRSWAASSEPDARYPRGITWAPPIWLALVRDAEGRLVGRAGVLERTVLWGGNAVRVGGVSSVSTDPDYQGRGVAGAAVRRLMQFMSAELDVDVGLLLASRMGAPVYARLGWQVVEGAVCFAQPEGSFVWTREFPEKPPMAWPCKSGPVPPGPVDLQGLPW